MITELMESGWFRSKLVTPGVVVIRFGRTHSEAIQLALASFGAIVYWQ